MNWLSVIWEPPPFITENKPWWKFWRRARKIATGHHGPRFVAIGEDGTSLLESPNGVTWAEVAK